MRGGDLVHLIHTELPELRRSGIRIDTIHFVHNQNCWLFNTAQMLSNRFICNRQTRAAIHHKQHHISFVNRSERLLCHFGLNAFFRAIDTAGIDHDKFVLTQLSLTVFAITR
ncbi:Uncharacterised protein [Vibrio cholerae]|nr:Uncharacterised protein [Vibrio cholerae]CSC78402.1 Uncharacterised protein [Vibrio cholerae]